MKKRVITLILCAAILAVLLPCSSEAEGTPLNFIAVNDTLPTELINAAVYYGGMIYVPSWLLKNYYFGITYSYYVSSTTACLESAEKQLFFNVSTGKTFDGDDYQYSVSAAVLNGTVYLPLSFICSFFGGFSYANIGGNEYGSILRIYSGQIELTDEEFLNVAKPAMRRQYETYYQEHDRDPETGGDGPEEQEHHNDTVRFGLVGLPREETLELLQRMGMTACFFLKAEEIRSDPDMVRRLACEGFSLGLCGDSGTAEEYEEAAALLWEAARVSSVMVALPPGTEALSWAACFACPEDRKAEDDRMAEIYAVTAALNRSHGDTVMLFHCTEEHETALNVLVYYLRDQGFQVKALRETDRA